MSRSCIGIGAPLCGLITGRWTVTTEMCVINLHGYIHAVRIRESDHDVWLLDRRIEIVHRTFWRGCQEQIETVHQPIGGVVTNESRQYMILLAGLYVSPYHIISERVVRHCAYLLSYYGIGRLWFKRRYDRIYQLWFTRIGDGIGKPWFTSGGDGHHVMACLQAVGPGTWTQHRLRSVALYVCTICIYSELWLDGGTRTNWSMHALEHVVTLY
jgi:hypothetical protein